MERIASFTVDHNKLVPGLYYSRRDGDIVTFDLRFKKPNTGDLLTNAQMHSAEHLIATLLRNSQDKEAVIYFGPMGCQTGFYFLFDNRLLSCEGAIALLQQVFTAAGDYTRQKPGRVRQLHQPGSGDRESRVQMVCGAHRRLDGGEAGLLSNNLSRWCRIT